MFVKESELFSSLKHSVIEEISRFCVEETHPVGSFPVKEGEPATALYILMEGKVRLTVGEEGRISFHLSTPGEAFGWSSLVERETYTASAECMEPCRLIRIEREKLEEVFRKDPESGMVFFKRLAGLISQRLITTYRTLLASYKGEGPPSYG